jgi:hypothetical protein
MRSMLAVLAIAALAVTTQSAPLLVGGNQDDGARVPNLNGRLPFMPVITRAIEPEVQAPRAPVDARMDEVLADHRLGKLDSDIQAPVHGDIQAPVHTDEIQAPLEKREGQASSAAQAVARTRSLS